MSRKQPIPVPQGMSRPKPPPAPPEPKEVRLNNTEILLLPVLPESENRKICKKCGGKCCQKMPCHFSPQDFQKLCFEELKQEIEKGYISIDYWIGDIDTTMPIFGYVYYLRIRIKEAPVVHGAWGGECIFWAEKTECPFPFENRPKGARCVIPKSNNICKGYYTKEMCVWDWRPYQAILERLAKYFGGRDE